MRTCSRAGRYPAGRGLCGRGQSAAPLPNRQNLVPFILDCVRAEATLGEINGVIRLANGEPYDRYGLVEPPVELPLSVSIR